MPRSRWLFSLIVLGTAVSWNGMVHAGPVRITCRDGGSRVLYEHDGRQSSERGVCDNDGACDGVCTFDFFPECVACNLAPAPPHENEPPECPCYGPQSPCDERFLVPVGTKRRTGRLVRTFQQSFASRFVLRCRPARRSCKRTAATTTTLPGVLDPTGIWVFTMTGLENTCPTGTPSPVETSIRIAPGLYRPNLGGCGAVWHSESYSGTASDTGFALELDGRCCSVGCLNPDGTYRDSYGVAGKLQGASTSAGADTLALTQEWILSPLGGVCTPCKMTWTGTMTRVRESP